MQCTKGYAARYAGAYLLALPLGQHLLWVLPDRWAHTPPNSITTKRTEWRNVNMQKRKIVWH